MRALLVAQLLVPLALLSACGPGSGSAHGVIQVVAAENVWGDIAAEIGGVHVHVTSIISDPNTDPHSYESDPADAAAVAGSKLVIENGVGYDDFVGKLLSASGGSHQVLDVQTVVGVGGSNPNPHLWYSPIYVTEAATAIEQQLATDDPPAAADLAANLRTFLAAYQPYSQTIAAIKAGYAGTAVSYTERVPGYLVQAAGLHLGTPASFSQAVEDGTDPTPADTAAFDRDLSDHAVKVLLYNSQVVDDQTTAIKKLATTAGVPVVGVSETVPPAYATFQAWQIAQARALLAALAG
jgi:zinc/manganese transport system substrate-binding protein